jgi:hypothetical protein
LETIKGLIAFIFSSAFVLVFLLLSLFSLPLCVLAMMHIWEWSLWASLVAVSAMFFIPIAGQLAYLVLAIMGGYYLIQADFNWREAAYPQTKAFSFATVSDENLRKFKDTVMRPGIEQTCKEDGLKKFGVDGQIPLRISKFCECYAQATIDTVSRSDLLTNETTGKYPPHVEGQVAAATKRMCSS